MLQQTQVGVVIPYFERWMEKFPTVEALAAASELEVLKLWEGLGYYSRAKNLRLAALQIMEHFGGKLPSDPESLALIKGIGPYTQGAIRGFAFKQKAAAVDGNVMRVLSRFLAFEEVVCEPKSKMKLVAYAEKMLPDDEPWLISEGLIELGALVCTKKAQCSLCPLKKECLSFRHHLQDQLPKKKARTRTVFLERIVAVIRWEGRYLLKREDEGKVMGGLYEFPYVECGDLEEGTGMLEKLLGLKLRYVEALPEQEHTFTHHRARLFPHVFEVEGVCEGSPFWKSGEEMRDLPFSSGHRRVLDSLDKEF